MGGEVSLEIYKPLFGAEVSKDWDGVPCYSDHGGCFPTGLGITTEYASTPKTEDLKAEDARNLWSVLSRGVVNVSASLSPRASDFCEKNLGAATTVKKDGNVIAVTAPGPSADKTRRAWFVGQVACLEDPSDKYPEFEDIPAPKNLAPLRAIAIELVGKSELVEEMASKVNLDAVRALLDE